MNMIQDHQERRFCGIDPDILEYLTANEKEQMEDLTRKAMQKKERWAEKSAGMDRLFFLDIPVIGEDDCMPGEDGAVQMELLLSDVCRFCLKHGLCQCPGAGMKKQKEGKQAGIEGNTDNSQ